MLLHLSLKEGSGMITFVKLAQDLQAVRLTTHIKLFPLNDSCPCAPKLCGESEGG